MAWLNNKGTTNGVDLSAVQQNSYQNPNTANTCPGVPGYGNQTPQPIDYNRFRRGLVDWMCDFADNSYGVGTQMNVTARTLINQKVDLVCETAIRQGAGQQPEAVLTSACNQFANMIKSEMAQMFYGQPQNNFQQPVNNGGYWRNPQMMNTNGWNNQPQMPQMMGNTNGWNNQPQMFNNNGWNNQPQMMNNNGWSQGQMMPQQQPMGMYQAAQMNRNMMQPMGMQNNGFMQSQRNSMNVMNSLGNQNNINNIQQPVSQATRNSIYSAQQASPIKVPQAPQQKTYLFDEFETFDEPTGWETIEVEEMNGEDIQQSAASELTVTKELRVNSSEEPDVVMCDIKSLATPKEIFISEEDAVDDIGFSAETISHESDAEDDIIVAKGEVLEEINIPKNTGKTIVDTGIKALSAGITRNAVVTICNTIKSSGPLVEQFFGKILLDKFNDVAEKVFNVKRDGGAIILVRLTELADFELLFSEIKGQNDVNTVEGNVQFFQQMSGYKAALTNCLSAAFKSIFRKGKKCFLDMDRVDDRRLIMSSAKLRLKFEGKPMRSLIGTKDEESPNLKRILNDNFGLIVETNMFYQTITRNGALINPNDSSTEMKGRESKALSEVVERFGPGKCYTLSDKGYKETEAYLVKNIEGRLYLHTKKCE